jgi:hypothetical protein
MVARDPIQHPVVEQDFVNRIKHPFDLDPAIQHRILVEQVHANVHWRMLRRGVVARLQITLVIRPSGLPVAERQGQDKKEQGGKRRPHARGKLPVAELQSHALTHRPFSGRRGAVSPRLDQAQ